jgi:hypothetical protein
MTLIYVLDKNTMHFIKDIVSGLVRIPALNITPASPVSPQSINQLMHAFSSDQSRYGPSIRLLHVTTATAIWLKR